MRSLISALVVVSLLGPLAAATAPEAAALAVLSSNAGLHEKARACQELGVHGSKASVAPLAALLGQEHLADYARSGLEGIADASASTALRQALPKLEGRYLAGVVNSLGVRREAAAVADLQKLVADRKRGVAPEAIASLGMIATADATKTLEKVLGEGPADLREPAGHALLLAAELLSTSGKTAAALGVLESVARVRPTATLAAAAQARITVLRSATRTSARN